MAGSLNRVMLIGRLTRDPELRYTPNGTAVCRLGLATNRYSKDQNGETTEAADFHDIVVWNQGIRKLAEVCAHHLEKGRLVYIEGRLQTRSWDDQETGKKRFQTEVNATDVQFLDGKRPADAGAGSAPVPAGGGAGEGGDIDPDDLPF